MNIEKIEVGELQTNCYILENNNNILIIDPGSEYERIKRHIINKNIIGILLTHSHEDHTGCINNFIKDYNIKIYDNNNLNSGVNTINNFTFEVIKTPGHTTDSISFYFKEDKVLFTGDFIFYNTIGRYDFPESNIYSMINSINKIKKYPNDIKIYPGHGKSTNLGYEKDNNPYFNINLL